MIGTGSGGLDVPTILIALVLDVYDLNVSGAIALKCGFPGLTWSHISVKRPPNSAATSTTIVSVMPIHTAILSISTKNFLVDKVLQILLSDLGLLVFLIIG